MRDELKPCPFCGSGAQFRDEPLPAGSACWVECSVCDIATKFHPSTQAAAKTWNTRVSVAAGEWVPVSETYDDVPRIAKSLERAIRSRKAHEGRAEYHVAEGYNNCVFCRLLWALTYIGPATITFNDSPSGKPMTESRDADNREDGQASEPEMDIDSVEYPHREKADPLVRGNT